jgi:hypothetical protein
VSSPRANAGSGIDGDRRKLHSHRRHDRLTPCDPYEVWQFRTSARVRVMGFYDAVEASLRRPHQTGHPLQVQGPQDQALALPPSRRPEHGGPKTVEGRARIAEAQRRP